MAQCSNCGATLLNGTRKCPQCGWLEIGGELPQKITQTAPIASMTVAAMAKEGADWTYRRTYLSKTESWKQPALVIPDGSSTLPPFCIRCGAPTTTTLSCAAPVVVPGRTARMVIYLIVVPPFGLVYLLLRGLLSQTVPLEVPLCEPHLRGRKNGMRIGAGLMLLAIVAVIAVFVVGAVAPDWDDAPVFAVFSALVGLVLLIAGILIWIMSYRLVRVRRLSATEYEVTGMDFGFFQPAEAFLKEHSAWPSPPA